MMTAKAQFLALLPPGEAPEETLVEALSLQAEGMMLGYLRVKELPPQVDSAKAMLMAVLYTRQGAFGESAHAEGEIKSVFEALPPFVLLQLQPYRRAGAL